MFVSIIRVFARKYNTLSAALRQQTRYKKGRISIYFLFCDNLIIPASVKVIHSVSKNYQESCRDQYNTDYNGNGIDCTGKSKVAL